MKKKHCTAAYTQNELELSWARGMKGKRQGETRAISEERDKPPPTAPAAAEATTLAAASQNLNDNMTNRQTKHRRQLFMYKQCERLTDGKNKRTTENPTKYRNHKSATELRYNKSNDNNKANEWIERRWAKLSFVEWNELWNSANLTRRQIGQLTKPIKCSCILKRMHMETHNSIHALFYYWSICVYICVGIYICVQHKYCLICTVELSDRRKATGDDHPRGVQ